MQQQAATVVRDTAAVDHAVRTLDGKMRVKKREFEMLQCVPAHPANMRRVDRHAALTARPRAWSFMRRQRHRAELESEAKYLKAQYDLQDKYSEQGARAHLKDHEACVKKQIAEAEAERKEVRHCSRGVAAACWRSAKAAAADVKRRRTQSMLRTCRPSSACEACPSR